MLLTNISGSTKMLKLIEKETKEENHKHPSISQRKDQITNLLEVSSAYTTMTKPLTNFKISHISKD